MLRTKQRLSVASAVAVLVVWVATANGANGRPEQQEPATEPWAAQGVTPDLQRAAGARTAQEVALPAGATEEELTALYSRLADDFARRLANASAGEVVTVDPRRIGALY